MSFIEKITGVFQNKNTSQTLENILPVLSFEKDLMVMKNGRVAIGYVFEGVEMEKWSAHEYLNAGQLFDSSLKGLPKHSIVQKIDIYYNDYMSKERDLNYFESQTVDHFLGRPVLCHKSYFFIISPGENNAKPNEINNSFASYNKIDTKKSLKNIETRLNEWQKTVPSYIQELGSIPDVTFSRLNTEDLKELYRMMLNMEFRFDPGQPYKTIYNQDNYLTIGDKKLNVISLVEQSKTIDYSKPCEYGVTCPFTYNVGIYMQLPHIVVKSYTIDDTEKELERLDRERKLNFAATQFGGDDTRIKDEELGLMTEDIRSNQKRLVSMSKQIIIYTLGEQARERNLTNAIAEVRTWDSANALVETYYNTGMFFSCLPGNASESVRWITMPSDVATAYLDFTTSYKGGKSGDLIADRFRNLVHINLFNRALNNQNCIVIGPSGSGKSFTMGHFILQRFERKERQIIIDAGGTYKNIFEALGCNNENSGVKYYEYNPEKPISFNPFLFNYVDKRYEVTEDKISFLLYMFGLIWKGAELDREQKTVLSKWISNYYNDAAKEREKDSNYKPNIRLFTEWLKKYNEEKKGNSEHKIYVDILRIDRFLVVLDSYSTGKYKALLNNPDTLDISDYPLVCFDMARVKENAELYPLVTMLLTELSMDVIRKYPDDIKYFKMDEAWSMFSGSMEDFINNMFRTLRKNNGSMTVITQGIGEIVASKVGQAMINNSDTKIILNHSDATKIEELGRHLGFTNDEMRKIASIRKGPDSREFFIKQGNESNVFTLEVNASEHAVLTSHPVERNHLNRLKEKYVRLTDAINQWVEDKNNGFFKNK